MRGPQRYLELQYILCFTCIGLISNPSAWPGSLVPKPGFNLSHCSDLALLKMTRWLLCWTWVAGSSLRSRTALARDSSSTWYDAWTPDATCPPCHSVFIIPPSHRVIGKQKKKRRTEKGKKADLCAGYTRNWTTFVIPAITTWHEDLSKKSEF